MFSGLFGSLLGLGGSLIGSGIQVSENAKNRKWQSEEAALNRDFQHQESSLARNFTENFYQRYQSPQALLRQGTAAGLHPYQALGLDPASGVSSPMPQGSQANLPHQFDVGSTLANGINNALAFLEQKSRIDLNNNLGKLYDSQRTGQDIENQFNPLLFDLQIKRGYVDIDNMRAGIEKFNSETNLNKERALSEVVNRDVSRKTADNIVANTNKTILEQATEKLKQDNIKATNVKLAREVKKIELEYGLIACQKALLKYQSAATNAQAQKTMQDIKLVKSQVDSIKLDNLEKQWEQIYRDTFNMQPPQGSWGAVLQLFSAFGMKGDELIHSIF